MVACDLPLQDFEFMLHRNLPEEVADAEGHRPHEHRLPILRGPDEVGLAVRFGVRSNPVVAHATILPHPVLRLKARVFTIPDAENKSRASRIKKCCPQ
jgi:hypothetical protein